MPSLIDAHAHIGHFRGYDLSLETLLAEMDAAGIASALVSNIDGADLPGVTANLDETAANDETARVARGIPPLPDQRGPVYPRLVPLLWARPGDPRSDLARAERYLRDQGFRGIKLHPDFNHFDADGEAARPYLALCKKYRRPAVFHAGVSPRSRPRAIYAAARRFPTVPFVLYHMGFGSPDHDEAIAVAREARTRGDALVYLETSQADPEAVLRAVRLLGADRVLFGTDATYFGRGHYRRYAPLLTALGQSLSPADYARVVHGNAARLFALDEPRR